MKDLTVEDIIERNSILDVLWHGRKMGERFNDIGFGSTYGMIEKYGNLEEKGSDYYNT